MDKITKEFWKVFIPIFIVWVIWAASFLILLMICPITKNIVPMFLKIPIFVAIFVILLGHIMNFLAMYFNGKRMPAEIWVCDSYEKALETDRKINQEEFKFADSVADGKTRLICLVDRHYIGKSLAAKLRLNKGEGIYSLGDIIASVALCWLKITLCAAFIQAVIGLIVLKI